MSRVENLRESLKIFGTLFYPLALRAESPQPCLFNSVWSHGLYPPGPFVHGVLQARILGWAAMPSSRGSSRPRDRTRLSCIGGGAFFTTSSTWESLVVTSLSRVRLFATTWTVAYQAPPMGFSRQENWRGSSPPRDQTRVSRIVGRRFTVWATREGIPLTCSNINNFPFLKEFVVRNW